MLPCGHKHTCSHFQAYKTVHLRHLPLTMFIFGIERMQLCTAATNLKKSCIFFSYTYFTAHSNKSRWLRRPSFIRAQLFPASQWALSSKMCVHTVQKVFDTNKTWQSHQQRLFCLSVRRAATLIVYDKNRFCKISPWITPREVNSLWFIPLQVGGGEPLSSSSDGRSLSG